MGSGASGLPTAPQKGKEGADSDNLEVQKSRNHIKKHSHVGED